MTKIHGTGTDPRPGILSRLSDTSGGRRSLRWLSERSGIAYNTLKRRMKYGRWMADELFAIADAFGCELIDLYREPTEKAA